MARLQHLVSESSLKALEQAKADALIASYAKKGVRVLPSHAAKLRSKGLKVKRA